MAKCAVEGQQPLRLSDSRKQKQNPVTIVSQLQLEVTASIFGLSVTPLPPLDLEQTTTLQMMLLPLPLVVFGVPEDFHELAQGQGEA